ncbi:hypothetical protein BDN72DRAFT_816375 [Pluteus cervinus]|uniref:Uncharacterized protein n=1 Tax=Pluteus cervinus TaxID=181527 RepID=A0ACD3B3I2_9AGAR|nr:hypothetical protein BDN72DRAFT_816375 [Pluteus cervinus]
MSHSADTTPSPIPGNATTATGTTYDLFFTGKDDPRCCVVIGEDTKPVYFAFETERGVLPNVSTLVYKNNNVLCARLDWLAGNHLGSATIGSRQLLMTDLVRVSAASTNSREFESSNGQRFEWRRCRDNPTSYDLYAIPNSRIAVFRRCQQQTVVGPSHGLFQYAFNHEAFLLEALITLCLNRWIDLHGV